MQEWSSSMSRTSLAVGAALIQLSMISAANAAGSARATLQINAYVPAICRATLNYSPTVNADGSVDLGKTQELCNLPQGYALVADYQYASGASPGTAPGTLYVDGQAVAMSPSGRSTLVQSVGPASVSRRLVYMPGGAQLSSFNVSVVAVGG